MTDSGASSTTLTPSGPAHLDPCQEGQLYCAALVRHKACSPECYSRWGQSQFSLVLQPLMSGALSVQPYPHCLRWQQEPQTSPQTVATVGHGPRHSPLQHPRPMQQDLGGNTGHSDLYGLAETQPLGTRMALVVSPNPWCLSGSWWQYRPWMSIQTPECSWIMDADMALAAAVAQMPPWPGLAMQVTQTIMHPAPGWPLNTHQAQGGSSNPRHPHGHWWQQEPLTSMKSLTAMGPWTQTMDNYLSLVLPL